jgi:hypothetical protein
MIYDDKIMSFSITAFPVRISLVITQDHCLSLKMGTVLVTIFESHLYKIGGNE